MEREVKKPPKKSLAKAAGLKSTFVISPQEKELAMTAFGRGNDALLQKRIVDGVVRDVAGEKQQFQVQRQDESRFRLQNSRLADRTVTADDPLHSAETPRRQPLGAGMDQLRRKAILEQKYFGRTFDDNIHIQLIYNILDIHKMLAVPANHIVHTLNLLGGYGETDFVGMLPAGLPYDKLRTPDAGDTGRNVKRDIKADIAAYAKRPQLAYLGAAFYDVTPGKSKRDAARGRVKSERDVYTILSLMSLLRQFCAHNSVRIWGQNTPAALYHLQALPRDMKDLLDDGWRKALGGVNDHFLDTNKVNLLTLFEYYGAETKQARVALTQDFYRFVVLKEQKNMGFSLKRLREELLKLPDAAYLTGQEYDSVRQKLYMLLDFLLCRLYAQERADRCEELVSALRCALSDEEKDAVYQAEAAALWQALGDTLRRKLLPLLKGKKLQDKDKKKLDELGLSRDVLDGVLFRPAQQGNRANADYFCRLMHLSTWFMDGKEINTLLTTLISKLENIDSLRSVLESMGLACSFVPAYAMFDHSRYIAGQLRVVNNIARMRKPAISAKREMYRAAVVLLGVDSPEAAAAITDDLLQIDPETGKVRPRGDSARDTGLRNFIANNVVESRRFTYLLRYMTPEQARVLAQNEKLIAFVLSTVPGAQLERYCRTCGREDITGRPAQIRYLTAQIMGVRYESFTDVEQRGRGDNPRKERYKALIGLYLTVLYLAVKNMVNCNARYVIAFYCRDRDTALYQKEVCWYDLEEDKKSGKQRQVEDYTALTRYFVSQGYLNRHACGYLRSNMNGVGNGLLTAYRNAVDHLNVIPPLGSLCRDIGRVDSYFALYYYAVQQYLNGRENQRPPYKTSRERELFAAMAQHRTWCSDLVKALNTPFGYNLARYKNLSIDGLFDREGDHVVREDGEKPAE